MHKQCATGATNISVCRYTAHTCSDLCEGIYVSYSDSFLLVSVRRSPMYSNSKLGTLIVLLEDWIASQLTTCLWMYEVCFVRETCSWMASRVQRIFNFFRKMNPDSLMSAKLKSKTQLPNKFLFIFEPFLRVSLRSIKSANMT